MYKVRTLFAVAVAVLTLSVAHTNANAQVAKTFGMELKGIEAAGPSDAYVGHWSQYVVVDATPHIGTGVFILGSNGAGRFRQFYGGPTLKYGDLIEILIGMGLEIDGDDVNGKMGAVAITAVPLFGTTIHANYTQERSDHGSNSIWQRGELFVPVTEQIAMGLTVQTKLGLGPRVAYSLPWRSLTIWDAAMFNHGHVGNVSSLTFSF